MSEIADPSKLKVTELRSELQARGLDSKGNKPVLVERLREALEAEKENEEEEECEAAEESKEEEEVEEENEPEVEESKETAEDKASQEEDNAEQQAAAEPPVDQEEVNEEQIEETPAEETPAEETPAEETPAEETPAEESPAEETPAEETPAEETPAEESPAEESPAEPAEDQEPVKDADVAESQKEKESFEEAPVEDVDADEEKMEQEEELEDTSAVDLIKDDFFNGHTDELQDLEEDDDVKDESAAVPPVEKEEEATPATDVKLQAEEDQEKMEEEDEFWDHKRGRKRAGSPIKEEDEAAAKKSRSDEVCIVSPAEAVQTTDVVLDLYNSDLSLKINKETCLSACPHMDKSFAYMWHGARATYGFTKGRVCFEVTLEKNLHVPHIDETEEHPHVLRVGWSVDDSSFTLGEDPRSWGYGGTGKASTDLKFKDYGVTFKAGDVVGAYLDLDVVPAVMSFTVNGVYQGIAYEIGKAEVDDQPLFPHILTKNVCYNVNFGSREEPMATQLEGYTYVGHVPLAERVQGSQGPMHKEDCEVIMMVGLPACGKTTWVQKYVGENKHMKYTMLGTNDLIEKMKVQGGVRSKKCASHLFYLSHNRLRNYIIDHVRPMF